MAWGTINTSTGSGSNIGDVVSVEQGGTGRTELTLNSYLVGNGTDMINLKLPEEVRTDIGAAPATCYGTEELIDGVSPLADGVIYVKYQL